MRKSALVILLLIILTILLSIVIVKRVEKERKMKESLNNILTRVIEGKDYIHNISVAVMNSDGTSYRSASIGMADSETERVMTDDTPYYIASITKMYTAVIIMKLYEENRLDLNDPISKYLPNSVIEGLNVFDGVDYSSEITIHQLLSHTSGIADYYSDKTSQGETFYNVCKDNPERVWTVLQTIDYAKDNLKSKFPPGEGGAYSDTNYQLLGLIIENITDLDLGTVFKNEIFRPAKMDNTWLVNSSEPIKECLLPAAIIDFDLDVSNIRKNGSYWADGGIVSTSKDSINFIYSLKNGKIISKDSLELMHKFNDIEPPLMYGYGTMALDKLGLGGYWGHLGSSGSFLFYSIDSDAYITGTINSVDNHTTVINLIKSLQYFADSQFQ